MNNSRHLVITVHGIRTFGAWQERLEALLKEEEPHIEVVNYKYGYFSVIAFILPFFRWLVTRRFRKDMLELISKEEFQRIDIVAHSFGTHLVGWGLYGMEKEQRPAIHTIVLSGSVLKPDFPWAELLTKDVSRLVNDCGVRDSILLLNQVVVPFTGLAGRAGFSGMTGSSFRNRYFELGHSGYFETDGRADDAFMCEYWLPLLLRDEHIALVPDPRKADPTQGLITFFINNAEPIKLAVWLTPLVLIGIWINSQRVEAERQKALAETERTKAETQRNIAQFRRIEAEEQRNLAQQRLAELSFDAAAEAEFDGQPHVALAKLVECLRNAPDFVPCRQLSFSILTDANHILPTTRRNPLSFDDPGLAGEVDELGFLIHGDAQLWKVTDEKGDLKLESVYRAPNRIMKAIVSPDRRHVAVWHFPHQQGNPGEITLLAWQDGNWFKIGSFAAGAGHYMAFSPDNRWLYAASLNNRYLWSVSKSKLIHEAASSDSFMQDEDVLFTPDSKFAVWIAQGFLWRADLQSGQISKWIPEWDGQALIPEPSRNSSRRVFMPPGMSLPPRRQLYLAPAGGWALVSVGNNLFPVSFTPDSSNGPGQEPQMARAFEPLVLDGGPAIGAVKNLIALPDNHILIVGQNGLFMNLAHFESGNFDWSKAGRTESLGWYAQIGAVLSPHKRWIIRELANNELQLWDLVYNAAITSRRTFRDGIDQAAFSGDGSKLVILDEEGGIQVWSVEGTGWPQFASYSLWRELSVAMASPRHDLVISNSSRAEVVSEKDGVHNRIELPVSKLDTSAVAFVNDGQELAVAVADTLLIFDAANLHADPATVSHRSIDSMELLDPYVLGLIESQKFVLLETRTWKEIAEIPLSEYVVSAGFRFSYAPAGHALLFVDSDNEIAFFDLGGKGKKVTMTVPGEIRAVGISKDGLVGAAIDQLGWLRIYDLETFQTSSELLIDNEAAARLINIDTESNLIAVAGTHLSIFDLQSGKLLFRRAIRGSVDKVAFSKDLVLAASSGYEIRSGAVWRFRIPDTVSSDELISAGSAVAAMTISADSRLSERDPFDYLADSLNESGVDWLRIRDKGRFHPDIEIAGLFANEIRNASLERIATDPTFPFRDILDLQVLFPCHAFVDGVMANVLASSPEPYRRPVLAQLSAERAWRNAADQTEVWKMLSLYASRVGDVELAEIADAKLAE